MATRKIFVINGEETTKKQSSIGRNRGMARKSGNPNINYWSGLHVFTILCCCGLVMSILTLIPRHDPILDQKYWFEINILMAGTSFIMQANMVLDFVVLLGKRSLVTIRFFLKNWLAYFLTWIIGVCTIYVIWTMILEYNYPMPWWVFILYIPTKIVSVLSVPLMLLRGVSLDDESKKKLKNFVWFELCWLLTTLIKMLVGVIFEKLENTDAQCLVALLFPMAKRFVSYFLSKMMSRIVGSENERANFNLGAHINLSFGLFIAISILGSRPATVACMVVVDALMQLAMTYQIIKLHKKITADENGISNKQKDKVILKLVLAELCEGLLPLAYAVSFSMVYYGPNAELLGFGENNYWPVKIVGDVNRTFMIMLGLFLMDIVSLSLNSSILWIFCKVNLFKKLCSVLHKYWYILAIKMANDVWLHFCTNDVNFGNDNSGQFVWIQDATNISLTSKKMTEI